MAHLKHIIAEKLLQIEAVTLSPTQPFTWTSGIKAPIYCDNRLILSYPKIRTRVVDAFIEKIKHHFPSVEVIAGTATAGIPHAAWISDHLDLPMVYVRPTAKSHGKGNQIEGVSKAGQKVVVVEDLISTGGSAIAAVEALRAQGCDVLGVVAIFTYGLPKATQNFADATIPFFTLSNYQALLEVASSQGVIKEGELATLKQWNQSPETWSTQA